LLLLSITTVKKTLKIPKGVTRNRKPKKDKQYNGQRKKDKRINNDLQNTTQKTKDRGMGTSLKQGMKSDDLEG
jgi:hypothetical protein